MEKLTIKLKQHTPLIHFQYNQEGATLRASEVKPKLDKFILTRLGNGNYQVGIEQAKTNGWLVGKGDHPALDYKMRIEAPEAGMMDINERQKYTDKHEQYKKPYIMVGKEKYLAKYRSDGKRIFNLKPYPLYFANMDADYYNPDEYRKFSLSDTPIFMNLLFKSESLYKHINDAELLNDFFFQTNFGTRQSKGFGSFTIDKSDKLYLRRFSKYRFSFDVGAWWENGELNYIDDEFERLFRYIEWFYKTLRGGINIKKGGKTVFYFKSLAYKYSDEYLKAKWDKRKIKEDFYGIDKIRKPNTFDIRDMLGFSTNEMWLSYGKDSIEKKVAIWDEVNKKYRYPKPNEKLPIERMQSPLLFKPIYNGDICTINILIQEGKTNMQGFKDGGKVCVYSKNKRKFIMLDIPKDFSTVSFLNYFLDESNFDISEHVDSAFHGYREKKECIFDILEDIYAQIRENL